MVSPLPSWFIGTLLHAAMYLCDFNKHRPSSFTFNIKKYECMVNYIFLSKKYFIDIFLLVFFSHY